MRRFGYAAQVFGLMAMLIVFAPSLHTHAQSSNPLSQNRQGAVLELSPMYPRPGQLVTVKLKQYVSDPKFLLVTWKLNGQILLQGYEETSITFTAGPVGSLVVLEADIKDLEGRTATAKKTFRISDVAFVWEARSYTPPFYQGRPRLSYGSPAALVVTPTVYSMDGRLYNKDELSYVWMVGMQQETSGVGKNTVVVAPNSPFSNFSVTVQIFDPTGEKRMVYDISIPQSPAKLLFYEDDPLLGILYRSAITNSYNLTKEELKLVAEPLYMSVENRLDPSLSYSWNVNNTSYNFPGSVVLRPEGELSGTTNVSLTIINTKSILERVQQRISVLYSTDNAAGYMWTDPATESL